MLLRELPPEKYWSFPSQYSKERRKLEINDMISKGGYYFQTKIDGNMASFICDFDGDKRLISRGISKTTGEYGRLEDKVFFFDTIAAAFDKPTRLIGEIYLNGGVDKNVGSILRASSVKAKSIQDNAYYEEAKSNTKFSAKDKRDIEKNEFRNQKLKFYIFDVWYYDGEDLMNTPWIERQKFVQEAVKRINHSLVSYAKYQPVDENFYEELNKIFEKNGEGTVIYSGKGLPEPGKRTAHKTVKIKRELENLVDVFISGTEPPVKVYTGKDIAHWQYWEDHTGQRLYGNYFGDYQLGVSITPVTKGWFYDWPAAICVAAYNKAGEEVPICKVSGLIEEFKTELRDNYEKYDHCPVTIGGMSLSTSTGLSIRHPYLHSIRLGDIDPKDCTLEKILNNN